MSEQPRFTDLAYLTDREIQTLLREVDQVDCVVALKGASEAVAMRFLGNMSDQVSSFIRKENIAKGSWGMSSSSLLP